MRVGQSVWNRDVTVGTPAADAPDADDDDDADADAD